MLRRLWGLNTLSAELFLSALALSWGMWLLLPFESYTTTPTYRYLSAWGPEWIFGMLTMLVGIIQYVGVLLGVTNYFQQWRFRIGGGILGVAIWGSIALSFWLSNPFSTAPIIYTITLLGCMFIALRLSIMSGKLGHHLW